MNSRILTRKILGVLLTSVLALSTVRCGVLNGDNNLFLLSSLFNSRLTVILKGTYATDNPLNFDEINNNRVYVDSSDDDATGLLRNPVDDGCSAFSEADCVPRLSDLPIYLDIGEIRISSRSPLSELVEIQSQGDSEKLWDVVTTERQVYCSQAYTIDFDNSCFRTGGLINYQEFMNGRGAVYPSRDVPSPIGNFWHTGVYVRALAFGWSLDDGALTLDTFDNFDIIGARVTPVLQYDPNVDDATQALLPPQWFPLHHKVTRGQEQTMILDYSYTSAVLEIRWNLKENLMVHTFQNQQGRSQAIVAISDWRRNHSEAGATDGGFFMGGNVLTRSRIYYPGRTTTLRIDGGVQSDRHYYAVYVTNEEEKADQLPLAAVPVRNGATNEMTQLMAGSYQVECRYDCNDDGYPELVQSVSDEIFLVDGPGVVTRSFPCGCGINSGTVGSCVADSGCY